MPKFSCPGFNGSAVTDEAALTAHIAQQAKSLAPGAFANLLQTLLANPAVQAIIQALLAKLLNQNPPAPAP
jgi:hypothetical protein